MNRTEIKNTVKSASADGGYTARHTFLAFALLRERPYRSIELTRREDNVPSATAIAAVFGADVEAVKAWLAVPATPEMIAEAAEARAVFMAAKAQRSLAFAPKATAAE